jgi:hypothetical protein
LEGKERARRKEKEREREQARQVSYHIVGLIIVILYYIMLPWQFRQRLWKIRRGSGGRRGKGSAVGNSKSRFSRCMC